MKVFFPADYPFFALRVTMLTKMFHPNIDGGGRVAYPGDGDVVRAPAKTSTLAFPSYFSGRVEIAAPVLAMTVLAAMPATTASRRSKGGSLRGIARRVFR